jgi:hypothetical protein
MSCNHTAALQSVNALETLRMAFRANVGVYDAISFLLLFFQWCHVLLLWLLYTYELSYSTKYLLLQLVQTTNAPSKCNKIQLLSEGIKFAYFKQGSCRLPRDVWKMVQAIAYSVCMKTADCTVYKRERHAMRWDCTRGSHVMTTMIDRCSFTGNLSRIHGKTSADE